MRNSSPTSLAPDTFLVFGLHRSTFVIYENSFAIGTVSCNNEHKSNCDCVPSCGSRRRAEEDYYRQILAQGVQQGFSQEYVQDELRRIDGVNKLRQVVLVLVIVLLTVLICSFIFSVPRLVPPEIHFDHRSVPMRIWNR